MPTWACSRTPRKNGRVGLGKHIQGSNEQRNNPEEARFVSNKMEERGVKQKGGGEQREKENFGLWEVLEEKKDRRRPGGGVEGGDKDDGGSPSCRTIKGRARGG